MKKHLFFATALAFVSLTANAQAITDAVKATLVSKAANELTVFAKSKAALVDKHFNNIVLSISIVDPGVGNRPNLTVTTNHIPDVAVSPQAPYAEGGRYHYDFIAANNSNAPSVNTNTWSANTSYPVLTVTASNNNEFNSARLDHWDSPNFGANAFSQFYFEIIQSGGGDITAQTDLFFGTPTVVNDPGGWGGGTSFVPIQPIIVLPVKFLGFTVTKSNNSAILNWSVESEDANTDKYEILRSSNGVDFTTVATISTKNNGRSANSYSFTQENLSNIRNTGVIYFRIKQIDKDGKSVITEIKNVRLTSKGLTIGVYPNPIKHSTNVSFDLVKDAEVILTVNDASGKQLMISQFNGFKGSNIKSLDLSKFATGNYILKLQTSTDVNTLPIVKANN